MNIGLSTALSGGAGLLGSVFGGIFGNYQQKKANEYNRQQIDQQFQRQKELAQYQYDLNLQQWNRENEYNSPTSQLARLRAAGLNPHLIYGHGAVANQSSPSPKYEAPQPGVSQMVQGDIMGNVLQGQELFQNVERFISDMSNLRTQRAYTAAKTAETLAKVDTSRFDLDMKRKLEGYTIQAADLSNQNLQANLENTRQRTENLKVEYHLTDVQAKKVIKETNLISAKIVAQAQQNAYDKEANPLRLRQLQQSIAHTGAEIAQIMQSIRESKSRVRLQQAEWWNKNFEYKIKTRYGEQEVGTKLRQLQVDLENSIRKAGYGGETGNVMLLTRDVLNTFLGTFGLDDPSGVTPWNFGK